MSTTNESTFILNKNHSKLDYYCELYLWMNKYTKLKLFIQYWQKNFIQSIITKKSKLLYTPIAREITLLSHCSKTNWNEQLNRKNLGQQMMWDDSSTNRSNKGDILATCFNRDKVDFYIIKKVLSPSNRLSTWSDSIGHSNRNVLYIDSLNYSMSWNQWINLCNYSSGWYCMGTKNAGIKTQKNIISHLLENI